ncbi:hypothetical protein NBH19_08100 [Rhizobium sp. S95]|uniref:YD repeat-containing protein n=1 Tax=Ciceribacter sichuanensis TaxID=2949647 RepID=A0AAJ1C1R5_9HYPH|nr:MULTISPECIES: hypothetical protein [unclassified Ciceribacter]MCM2396043.1 hypothetical protein [Ciceribacter sp. S95]MCO5960191.1 hypothetical protein [Ciceribacter sp. S101]
MSGFLKFVYLSALLAALSLPAAVGAWADEAEASFGYDQDGRLTTGRYGQSRCVVYAYDPVGNRTSQISHNQSDNTPTWGDATWDAFSWTTGAVEPMWGAGTWGCVEWSEN